MKEQIENKNNQMLKYMEYLRKPLIISTKLISLVFLLILMSACVNYRNVELVGQILDEETKMPIKGAMVMAYFWVYDTSTAAWESKRVDKSVLTDKNGAFSFKIAKAESFDLSVENSGYRDYDYAHNLNKSKNNVSIYLTKKQ